MGGCLCLKVFRVSGLDLFCNLLQVFDDLGYCSVAWMACFEGLGLGDDFGLDDVFPELFLFGCGAFDLLAQSFGMDGVCLKGDDTGDRKVSFVTVDDGGVVFVECDDEFVSEGDAVGIEDENGDVLDGDPGCGVSLLFDDEVFGVFFEPGWF